MEVQNKSLKNCIVLNNCFNNSGNENIHITVVTINEDVVKKLIQEELRNFFEKV